MPISVRLDQETDALVRRLSRSTQRSKSQVIRDAIRRLAADTAVPAGESAYEQIVDLVGIARGGKRHYAARSEEVLRALFARRRRLR